MLGIFKDKRVREQVVNALEADLTNPDRTIAAPRDDVLAADLFCPCECRSGGSCSHEWTGPNWHFPSKPATVGGVTATCRNCGLSMFRHDLETAP